MRVTESLPWDCPENVRLREAIASLDWHRDSRLASLPLVQRVVVAFGAVDLPVTGAMRDAALAVVRRGGEAREEALRWGHLRDPEGPFMRGLVEDIR